MSMLTLTLPPRVTDRAFERLAEIAAATGDARPLRVAVEGGGCSGFQYDIRLDEAGPDDLVLEKDGVQISMSDVGRCYDNAMQESFWATLKRECADHVFATREEAKRAIFHYMEVWYNGQRRHSALGYRSPAEFEQQQAQI
jgi:cation diffusion facilitator CzcD-associated flavoprotein CzcO